MMQTILSWVAGAVLTVMMAVVSFQQTQISQNENRIYALQKESVSEAKLKDMEERMQSNFNSRFEGIRLEIALTNKYLERILEDTRGKR